MIGFLLMLGGLALYGAGALIVANKRRLRAVSNVCGSCDVSFNVCPYDGVKCEYYKEVEPQ